MTNNVSRETSDKEQRGKGSMTREEKIKGLHSLKEYLVENPIELEDSKSLPITLIDYAIEALEQAPTPKENLVSLEVYKEVAKERDIAIEQLHKLGYEFGEKIEPTPKENLVDGDCISRANALKLLKDKINNIKRTEYSQRQNDYCDGYKFALELMLAEICQLPSVEPKAKTGRWIDNTNGTYTCSECGAKQKVIVYL